MDELNLKAVNLNDTIYFELNKGTLEALGDDRQVLADFIRYHVHDYTVDGKTVQLAKMQLWDFMLKFGKYFRWGGPGVTKDSNIFFRVECPWKPADTPEEPVSPGDSWLFPVKIGKQVWSGKNLSIDDGGEGIYHNEYNGETYYTWEAARRVGAHIPGWHLPTREEWQELVDYCGGNDKAGKVLKASTGWTGEANGSDDWGFSVVPGGNWNYSFRYVSLRAYFWTATENGCNGAYGRYFASCSTVYEYSNTRYRGFSVRLVKDSIE